MASEVPTVLKTLFSHIDANKAKYIEALKETVAIKSVSAWPESRPEIFRMVNWVADRLRTLGATIELADVGKQTLPDGRVIDLPNVILGTLGSPEVPVLETPKKVAEPPAASTKSPKTLQTPPASPLKILNNSPSPSGVNRRTAVLFTRKAQAALKKPETPSKEEAVIAETTELLQKSAKKTTRGKRSSKSKSAAAIGEPGFLGLPGPSGSGSGRRSGGGESGEKKTFEAIPDSFRVYRGGQDREISDSDDSNLSFTGSTCSSCSGFSGSGTESEFGSSSDDQSFCDTEMSTSETEPFPEKPLLEPLKLVWAKCRGYPWYPALIIDPEIPAGFVHNGVPLPAPPADVLALKANYDEQVFLVLFFDAKRTWQWLPANKLELLGVNKELDQNKLVESRKPTERKAVNKAYQEALHYHSQVSSADGPAGKL